jgi:protein TonB
MKTPITIVLLAIVVLLTPIIARSQDTSRVNSPLQQHLVYPGKAVRKKIEGTVVVQFIVDKDGSVYDMKALTGDPLLQDAALKAMANTPRWVPAMQDGRKVKSYKKQPIIFKLQ